MAAGERRLQPRRQPHQVRAELTRQRIVAAAAHVFAEYGYAAGTTNRIAERARVSIGSLYQYYPNKDALLLALLTRHVDLHRTIETLERHKDAEVAIEAIIRSFVRAAIENHQDDPRLLQVISERAPRSDLLVNRVIQWMSEITSHLRVLLETHPEVRVRDTDTAARMVASTVELTVHQLVATPNSVDATRLEDELVTMIVGYLRA